MRGKRLEVRSGRREVSGKKQQAKVRRSISLFFLLVLLLMVSFWLQGCQLTNNMHSGMQVKVTRVLSGQTLEVEETATAMKVRLVGIDAPSLQQQPWGEAALQQLETKIGGKTVLLEFDTQQKDAFGRNLAYVWHDGVLLNLQLVKEGYVLWMPRSPNNKYDRQLEYAQAYARLMGLGIWNWDRPMRITPAEFRQTTNNG